MPHDLPLPRVNTLGSDEGSTTLNELTVLCTKLSQKVESLEADLKQTKKVYEAAYTKLIMKGRSMIEEIDQNAEVHLVTPTQVNTQGEAQRRTISTASGGISTAKESVSTAGASMPVSTTGIVDKEQLDEEERQRITSVHEEASSFNVEEREDIQATIEADEELALRIQAEEREKYSKAEKARLLIDLINQIKRHFAQQRAKERRNNPMTQAQQRTYMSNYVKHMGSHILKQLKKLSFEELKNLFEATMIRVKNFTPMESDFGKTIPKIVDESSKRAGEEELE
nr:hypothetical protein [Tanacetum cinerariifolium]